MSITVEIVRHSLLYISEEMGVALRKSAFSPNIRERADHSCAILDSVGRLIGQAEHIPVHIGSLPLGLRNTIKYLEQKGVEVSPGDMFVLNDPYIAGTHLNDVTTIRPVFFNGRLA
ncbi:MAG: hydantoinase B/oxoprolinase family protein, partial [Candidatus Caldarchaeum sp.]